MLLSRRFILNLSVVALTIIFMLGFTLIMNNTVTVEAQESQWTKQEPIGFNFLNQRPKGPAGDSGAPDHVFIHRYPMPADGLITGVTYVNDSDPNDIEIPEFMDLLILRSVKNGFEVIHRITLPADDDPPTQAGVTMLKLNSALRVKKGDLFAHWQPKDHATGPIPANIDADAVAGLSAGRFGFGDADVAEGKIIPGDGFSGRRDYFINVIFERAR